MLLPVIIIASLLLSRNIREIIWESNLNVSIGETSKGLMSQVTLSILIALLVSVIVEPVNKFDGSTTEYPRSEFSTWVVPAKLLASIYSILNVAAVVLYSKFGIKESILLLTLDK